MKKTLLIAGVLALSAIPALQANNPETSVPGRAITREGFTKAAEETVNGVVSVKSFATPRQQRQADMNDFFNDPFFQFFFGNPGNGRQQNPQEEPKQQEPRQIGLGSGVIISADGYIVTNNHVIADAEKLEVTLNDNRNFTATVIGSDPLTDLALIKIEAEDLHVIPIGKSEDLKVGEWVLAVGNPFGFTSTVTAGIVSAKARNISTSTGTPSDGGIQAYIQHDAAVNSGNSGGALVNIDGELVGINTAIYSRTGTYAGCSFAIPTSIVDKVVSDLKQFGTVQRAVMGIVMNELNPAFIAEKKIKGINSGIYVNKVEDRSAAMEAGIEEGDIIIAINGVAVPSMARLQEIIAGFSPGDIIAVTLVRDGKKLNKSVKLRNRSGDTSITKPDNVDSLGATFENLSADECKRLELRRGVKVASVSDGAFKNAGIKKDFIIISINNNLLSDASDVEKIFNLVRKSNDTDKVLFISGLYPTGKKAYYAVNIGD